MSSISSIGENDWETDNDPIEISQTQISETQEFFDVLAMDPSFAILIDAMKAIQEGRFNDLFALLDQFVALCKKDLEDVNGLDTENLESRANELKDLEQYYYPACKSLLLVINNRPQEAIALCSEAIGNGVEGDEGLSALYAMRCLAYLVIQETDLAIADANQIQFPDSEQLTVRVFQQKMGVMGLAPKEIDETEFAEMDIEDQVDFYLANGYPERAIQLLENKTDLPSIEQKAIAYALLGQADQASECIQLLLPAPLGYRFVTSEALLYFIEGNYTKAMAIANETFDLTMIVMIRCVEAGDFPGEKLSLMQYKG